MFVPWQLTINVLLLLFGPDFFSFFRFFPDSRRGNFFLTPQLLIAGDETAVVFRKEKKKMAINFTYCPSASSLTLRVGRLEHV